ncbi:Error-prone DNA polymerase [Methyloligella halotolerans]|uniref:Error-prone DNA polymerase n=1 Tax=Methyloligella halotolerans TaxID=1177755 RepID=A0A1E2RZ77_9HYPH|nr:Error-prone DNA polymerase [Methyloligella halotolerans]
MGEEPQAALPEMPLPEHVVNDYRSLRLSLKAHPMQFLRDYFAKRRIVPCGALKDARDGARIQTAGVVLVRQRPGSAQGVVFMTIEDETGVANAVVWPKTFEKFRREVMGSRLIVIQGRIQRHEDIVHLVSQRLEDRSDLLGLLSEGGLEANDLLANADEVRRPDPGSWRGARLDKRREEAAFDIPVAHGDHVKHAGEDARARAKAKTEEKHDRYSRPHPRWRPKHPRSERIIPKSRDFH